MGSSLERPLWLPYTGRSTSGRGEMKITAVNVFSVEGGLRSGEALYETERLGLAPRD